MSPPSVPWSIFYNHELASYYMAHCDHAAPAGVVLYAEGPLSAGEARVRTEALNAAARQGHYAAALKEAYLLGKAAANEEKWAAITRALCGIEISVSALAFDEVHRALEGMVGEDGVFEWPREEGS